MKTRFLLPIVLGIVAIHSLIYTSCNFTAKASGAFPALIERKDTSGASGEISYLNTLYQKYTEAIQKDNADDASRIKLLELYLQEGRNTGNTSYYNDAAMKIINELLAKKECTPDIRYQSLTYKATILLSLHQFAQAKDIAQQALAINPFDADIYGALTDANLELGLYDEALKHCDKMMGIRPDIRSYSRVSYLRQIMGNQAGAIEAMRMAVESGAQGMENTEWARVQLGNLYLQSGHADTAAMLYESSLIVRPNYPYALMGLAKKYAAEKKYEQAIEHCKRAIKILSESSFVSYLGELTQLQGNEAKAKEIYSDVLELLLDAEKENEQNKLTQHNGHRELAQAYLHVKDYNNARKHAKLDWQMRPDNIDANELLGWIEYQSGDYSNAVTHIEKALHTNSKNAVLLLKASMIYDANHNTSKAEALKQEALQMNPLEDDKLLALK